MKPPIKKEKIKEIVTNINLYGKSVLSVIEEINRANINNYTDLRFGNTMYHQIEVYIERQETEKEFKIREDKYQEYLYRKENAAVLKKEKELKKKMSAVQKLEHELSKLKGEVDKKTMTKLQEKSIKKARLQHID